jgi:hypothetical protein
MNFSNKKLSVFLKKNYLTISIIILILILIYYFYYKNNENFQSDFQFIIECSSSNTYNGNFTISNSKNPGKHYPLIKGEKIKITSNVLNPILVVVLTNNINNYKIYPPSGYKINIDTNNKQDQPHNLNNNTKLYNLQNNILNIKINNNTDGSGNYNYPSITIPLLFTKN